ncbi:glycine-rich domain-containing protein [Pseudomonas sp. KNUC1026]|uniref:glycine-rich domain-containing protein n=1 Tax=Pseudomonas sp. KNUC1026 TaxID=2893890 RepID=UPI001F415CF1|nr:hypothetical protein [Pseudomonas sp. KNUC1026]UFH49934.1 hypothetical protein LN139_00650 [Pseudomonas sp. KNUC1026]
MDYPKSVANVGLVNGKFVDENTVTGVVGSLIPSEWGNAVTDEILAVIAGAGLSPAEAKVDQLLTAICQIIQSGTVSYATDTGSANTYKAAYTQTVTALTDGLILRFKAKTASTGPATFAPDSVAAKPITTSSGAALIGGEIAVGGFVTVQYSSALNAWLLLSSTGGTVNEGRLLRVWVFDAATTYYPIAQVRRVEVELVGGGGSGGGSVALSSGNSCVGGGGGAGGYAHSLIDVTDAMRTAGVPITIGAGAAASQANGSAGGTSSFGTYLSAWGGAGGSRTVAASTNLIISSAGVGGGGATDGVFPSCAGEDGAYGQNNPYQSSASQGGAGGRSAMGYGGQAQSINANGNNGNRGGGGSGVVSVSTTTAYNSGKGGNGCCVIREYY